MPSTPLTLGISSISSSRISADDFKRSLRQIIVPLRPQEKPLYSGPALPTWSIANKSPPKNSEDGHLPKCSETTLFTDQYLTGDLADDSETDYVDESAIDDDDDDFSDWEDSTEGSNKSSIDKFVFKRVDSKVNLTSRRSLITLMIDEQNGRSRILRNNASPSTSAVPWAQTSLPATPTLAVSLNDSDDAPLMMKRGARSSTLEPIEEVSRSQAQPIMATASHSYLQAALFPRPIRRNMLATELTESLRRNLLWERQQNSSTANAVLKPRHTSHDVANLKQYSENVCMNKTKDVPIAPPDFFANMLNFGGYHCRGW
nr:duf1752 domain containing protein [Colletotrichum truncatum]KAF6793892.1 duf1752 domain containing protein [Colletotrichum truncatum]